MATFDFTAPDGKQYSVEGPEGATPDQAFATLQQHLGAPAAQPTAGGLDAADIAKSGGIGLLKGGIGAAGMFGDARELLAKGINKGSAALGYEIPQTVASGALKMLPVGGMAGPTSEQITKPIEDVAGPLYTPQTTAGKFAEKIGEFAPAAISPGGIVRKAAQVVVPAVADQLAGMATEGTAAEPYARAAAAVAGGALAHKIASPASLSALKPTSADLIDAASAGYKSPEVRNVAFKTGVIDDISSKILGDLNNLRLNDRVAKQTRGIIEDLANPVNGGVHTIEDYQTARTLLGDVAGQFANPTEQRAASQAITRLDKYFGGIKQADLVSGDIGAATQTMARARQDYALGKSAQRVETAIDRADVNASSAHSGGNIDNTTRQALKPMLLSPKRARGLSTDDLSNIENVVAGSPTGNALRVVGKLLGGGGGLGALVTGGAGHLALGPVGLALPAVGYGIKKMGDAITRRNAQAVVDNIISRSPEAQSFAARQARMAASNPAPSLGYAGSGMLSGLLAAGGNGMQQMNPISMLARP